MSFQLIYVDRWLSIWSWPRSRSVPRASPAASPWSIPDIERREAERMASVAKALGDPIRLQLVDVLRKHAGKVCVCELVPLFELSQPTVSHHLKVLREAGIVGSSAAACGPTTTSIPRPLRSCPHGCRASRPGQDWRDSVLEARIRRSGCRGCTRGWRPSTRLGRERRSPKRGDACWSWPSVRPGEDVLEVAIGTGVELVRLRAPTRADAPSASRSPRACSARRAGGSRMPGSPQRSR